VREGGACDEALSLGRVRDCRVPVVGAAARVVARLQGGGPVRVAALFTRRKSVYRSLGADCYDVDRDARTFDLACPVVAHPPCRAWGKLRGMAKPRPDERDLAWFALWVVRHCGGVLEHPAHSGLWGEAGLRAGVRDEFGGLLVVVDQSWWGHAAVKCTGLYCVGCVPAPELDLSYARRTVESMCRAGRESTPVALAVHLLHLAGGVR
jgi:hypothetical protein